MTDECGNSCPLRHSCAPPSFLRRQESIPVFASGGAGEKMDPRMREDDRDAQMDLRMREDDAKKIYQLHSVPSTASRLTGR